jgi:hypothetical protein
VWKEISQTVNRHKRRDLKYFCLGGGLGRDGAGGVVFEVRSRFEVRSIIEVRFGWKLKQI